MAINQTAKQLGKFMRELRDRADVSTYDVEALHLRVSRRNLGRAEKGEALLNWATWEKIAKRCNATEAEIDLVIGMAMKAEEKGWWEEYRGGMPPQFQRYVAMEMEADRLRILEMFSITGLFQTVEYMRATLAENPLLGDEKLPSQEKLRQRRQTEVLKADGPAIQLLMPEGLLLLKVGGPEVQRRQLEHLRQLNERPNIDIRVLLHKEGAHAAMVAPFTLLEFDDPEDADTVYIESLDGCRYVENRDVVTRYRMVFGAAFAQAKTLKELLKDDRSMA